MEKQSDRGFVESSEYSTPTKELLSSSNFTMSSSDGDDLVDMEPSTSGCSSFVAHSQNAKEKKKERVKEYLKELKSMVPSAKGKEGRMGTLTALQHVLSRLKRMKGVKQKTKALNKPDESPEMTSNMVYESDSQISVSCESLKSNDELRIIVSTQDKVITAVSGNLKYVLGYPQDSWVGRSLCPFIHKRDLVTFNSVHHEEEDLPSLPTYSSQSKTFYFRLRKFKGLGSSGYSLRKQDSYVPFQCTYTKKLLTAAELQKEGCSSSSWYEGTSHSEASGSPPVMEPSTSKKCYTVIYCVPLVPMYTASRPLPEVKTFETRHTLFCSYCNVQPNMIPLLGYLPQEMLGASIFDFYHPNDLGALYDIYKKVITLKGITYRGGPIRLRTKNGDWVKVVTEWSSFVNPWTKRLEFIIGKHTLVQGPENFDVFSENFEIPSSENLPESVLAQQQKIKDLLLQPVETVYVGEPKARDTQATIGGETSKKTKKVAIADNVHVLNEKCGVIGANENNAAVADKRYQAEIEKPGTGLLFKDGALSTKYEQLNYSNGIKKFLLSQPRTFSSESDLKKSSSEEEEDLKEDETIVSDFDFDISVPKPPSFGSSTKRGLNLDLNTSHGKTPIGSLGMQTSDKVLVSEQEPRDDTFYPPPNTSSELLLDSQSVSKEVPMVVPTVSVSHELSLPQTVCTTTVTDVAVDCPVMSLTRESLWKHTLLQEQLYIANSSPDRNIMFLDKDRAYEGEHSSQRQKLKRIHSPDVEGENRGRLSSKARRPRDPPPTSPVAVLNPSFPLASPGENAPSPVGPPRTLQPPVLEPRRLANVPEININMAAPIQMVPFIPVEQAIFSSSSSFPTTSMSESLSSTPQSGNNVQWPYYPVSGVSFNPHVMVGFNQAGILQPVLPPGTPISLQHLTNFPMKQGSIFVSNTQAVPRPGVAGQKQVKEKSKKSSTITESMQLSSKDSSLEDTGSSLYYLETGSNTIMDMNNTNLHKLAWQMYGSSWLRPAPWLESLCYTPAIEMKYHLPKVKEERQLKKDCEEMKRLTQPDLVIEQLSELLESLNSSTVPFLDEEADYLLFPEPEDFEEQEECMCARINNCNNWGSHEHGIPEAMTKLRQSLKKEKRKKASSTLAAPKQSDFSIDMDSSDKSGPISENSSNKQDSVNEERSDSLNDFSDMTPSDQRSNNEAGSSLKESDGDAMSKQSDGSSKENQASSESESEIRGVNCDETFEKLFVMLNVCFPELHKELPPWLKGVELSRHVSLQYRLEDRDMNQTLCSDMTRMENMSQPELVETQLLALLEDIDQNNPMAEVMTVQVDMDIGPSLLERIPADVTRQQRAADNLAEGHANLGSKECSRTDPLPQRTAVESQARIDDQLFNKLFCGLEGV